jgi:hypothetical protein
MDVSTSDIDMDGGGGRLDAKDVMAHSKHAEHVSGLTQDANAFALSWNADPLCTLHPGQAQLSPQLQRDANGTSAGH